MRPLLFLLPLALLACDKDRLRLNARVPDCVRQEIEHPPIAPYQAVYRYRIDGEEVYVFEPGCCDWPGMVIDNQCRTYCTLPNFAWSNDRTTDCPDFPDERELIWEKE